VVGFRNPGARIFTASLVLLTQVLLILGNTGLTFRRAVVVIAAVSDTGDELIGGS
jgi:hypothetical protein